MNPYSATAPSSAPIDIPIAADLWQLLAQFRMRLLADLICLMPAEVATRVVRVTLSMVAAYTLLHMGRRAIIAPGVAAIMQPAGDAVARQQMAVGDLVIINAYALQVCPPLNAPGFDSDSEHAIQQELNRLAPDRTTLIIARRLSPILHAHDILVMDRGKVVERGIHAQLPRKHGLYARLGQLQQRIDEHELLTRETS